MLDMFPETGVIIYPHGGNKAYKSITRLKPSSFTQAFKIQCLLIIFIFAIWKHIYFLSQRSTQHRFMEWLNELRFHNGSSSPHEVSAGICAGTSHWQDARPAPFVGPASGPFGQNAERPQPPGIRSANGDTATMRLSGMVISELLGPDRIGARSSACGKHCCPVRSLLPSMGMLLPSALTSALTAPAPSSGPQGGEPSWSRRTDFHMLFTPRAHSEPSSGVPLSPTQHVAHTRPRPAQGCVAV